MKEIILLLILTGLNYSVFCQNINYEAFKGETVDVVMDIPFQKVSFRWYNEPDISEEDKIWISTINDDDINYASSPIALLTKIYHAHSKKDLGTLVSDKKLIKRFKVKKSNNYDVNHYRAEYQVVLRKGGKRIVIIKYTEIANGKEVGNYTLQAIRDRGWKVTELEELKDIEFIINSLNAKSFQAIYQQYKAKDEDLNRLRVKVRTPMPDNRLNLTTLAEVLKEIQKMIPNSGKN